MARRFLQLALLTALVSLCIPGLTCDAQAPAAATASPSPTASPGPSTENPKGRHERPFSRDLLTPEQQKKYDSMTPEQQEKMRDNWQRWQSMSPEERKRMRDNDMIRRQMMAQEIEAAIKESDLQLDDKTRDEYVMRYTEERRKIEQELQKERRKLVQDMIDRLKNEFQAKSSTSPAPSESPSPQSSGSTSK